MGRAGPESARRVEIMTSNGFVIVRGANALGFTGEAGVIVKSTSLEYTEGGIDVPVKGFAPTAILGASAVGGLTAYFNPTTKKILLYQGASEASGTLTDVTLVMLGH